MSISVPQPRPHAASPGLTWDPIGISASDIATPAGVTRGQYLNR
jgi:hypothetical protein